jgi:transposase InsO family protein
MSKTCSPFTGKPYGIQGVCKVAGYPRSSFYAQGVRQEGNRPEPKKRGPKPVISDLELLEHICRDLEQSPFHGEGHRKVWGRLKFGQGLRISRKRVLRLMREHHLLSPYRRPQGSPKLHKGEITTNAPNLMWGTDATRVFTAEDGYVWVFAAVEHWNAECVGWHVCKRGDRFAAMEPILMGLNEHFGSVKADMGRGLSLRMDHGTQYLSDHFQNQLRYWGITPSFAFLEEPETNGVVERFFRTLKEQVIYGTPFRNIQELREAVKTFIHQYNTQWLIEKNGFLSPRQAREGYLTKEAA